MEDFKLIIEIVLKVVFFLIDAIGLFKLYGKMGEKQWTAIVPFYKEYLAFKNVYNTKIFWIFMILDLVSTILIGFDATVISMIGCVLAIIVIVIQVKYAKNFAAAFGRKGGFAVLTFFFPGIAYLYAGYSNNVQYVGNMSNN